MSNITVVSIYKLTIGVWVNDLLFMQDYDSAGQIPDRIEIHNVSGLGEVRVLTAEGKVIYTKPSNTSFSEMASYAEVLDGLPIFTRPDEADPSHQASTAITEHIITLRALPRTPILI